MSAPAGDSASGAILRLSKEQALVLKKPVPGVEFVPGGESAPLEWTMRVEAPAEYTVAGVARPCPYAGAVFPVSMRFPANYPFKYPDMRFAPGLLYHPNVSKDTGELCGDRIAESFGPTKNTTDLAKVRVL